MYWLTLQPSRWYRLDLNHWHASSLSQPLKTVASVDLRGFCGSRVSGPAAVTREVSMDTAVKLVLTQVLFTRAISNAVHIQSCWNLFHYWRRASGFSFYTHSSELSGGFSKHQLFCMCACFEVRDISLLVIAMAASMLSAPCAAYKHFPLFSSHPNKFPWPTIFFFSILSHWKLGFNFAWQEVAI